MTTHAFRRITEFRGRRAHIALALLTLLPLAACGKKGPPLAPLNLIPEPPTAMTVKRVGPTVYLDMNAPRKNANGPGLVAVDHIEIYGVTVGTGLAAPANRDLLSDAYLIGKIAIKPPVDQDAPVDEEEAKKDTRPAPGDKVTFVEPLTEQLLQSAPGLKPLAPAAPTAPPGPGAPAPGAATPAAQPAAPGAPTAATPPTEAPAQPPVQPPAQPPVQPPAQPAAQPPAETTAVPPAPAAAPGAAPAPAALPPPTGPVRVYIVRGITRKGRPGPPSARVAVPLEPPPPPPGAASAAFTENAVTISWVAPVADVGHAPMTFNVYPAPSPSAPPAAAPTPAAASQPTASQPTAPAPLNDAPIAGTTFEQAGAQVGVERCFLVRTVERIRDVAIESDPSSPVCVTPRDIFPPAAPKGLAVVAMDGGVMNLIWDANAEPDLGGYVVLRGEAPGDTLQPLTPEPIHDTKFTDTGVKPGVRYVYAVVAVDRAKPPNRSAPSARIEETAR